MSTRAQIRFATRETGQSFSEHPSAIHAQFYKHSDGYPEGLGLDIADSIMNNVGVTNWEIEPLTHKHSDLEYIYYIWQTPGKTTWISIFERISWTEHQWECIFVGEPQKLIDKYKQNTNNDG